MWVSVCTCVSVYVCKTPSWLRVHDLGTQTCKNAWALTHTHTHLSFPRLWNASGWVWLDWIFFFYSNFFNIPSTPPLLPPFYAGTEFFSQITKSYLSLYGKRQNKRTQKLPKNQHRCLLEQKFTSHHIRLWLGYYIVPRQSSSAAKNAREKPQLEENSSCVFLSTNDEARRDMRRRRSNYAKVS